MAGILLLSGGVESTTLLHEALGAGDRALFLDYAQRAAAREWAAARAQCERGRVPLVRLDLAGAGEAFREGRVLRPHVPLPHRNLTALALGLSYAVHAGAHAVYLAVNQDDAKAYPSAGAPFLAAFRALALTLAPIEIATPYAQLSKAEVIGHGLARGADYALTYSCLLGHARHCGRCPQCRKRRQAFLEAGAREPDGFYESG